MRHKLAAFLPGMRDARHVFRHFIGSLAACLSRIVMSVSPIGHKCQTPKFCGIVLVASWRGSRFSSQSVPVVFSRCKHWSDGVESQAFGRALKHSKHRGFHPDQVHAATHLLGLEWSDYFMTLLPLAMLYARIVLRASAYFVVASMVPAFVPITAPVPGTDQSGRVFRGRRGSSAGWSSWARAYASAYRSSPTRSRTSARPATVLIVASASRPGSRTNLS